MKYFKRLGLLLFFLAFSDAYSQNANPSVGGAMAFESNPAALFTGIPDVNIPLYNIPTFSKNVNIDLTLRYNPLSVSAAGRRRGNCGSGWNINPGGVISKIAESFNDGDIYSFSFMGMSGKFSRSGNQLLCNVIQSNGVKMIVETQFTPDPNAFNGQRMTGFSIFDYKGHRYNFFASDLVYEIVNGEYVTKDKNFQLSDIYDGNNNLLVTFSYDTYQEQITKVPPFKYNELKVLSGINIQGYGVVDFDANQHMVDNMPGEGLWSAYNSMKVLDVFGNIVREFTFIQNPYTDNFNNFVIELTEVKESDPADTDPVIYKLFYRPLPAFNGSNPTIAGVDEWGYYNNSSIWCDDSDKTHVDPSRVCSGVLEKIIFPTGGCAIYGYESSTYSFAQGSQIDINTDTGLIIPDFYYNLNEPKNFNNYKKNFIGISTQGSILSFQVTGSPGQTTRVYFKFGGLASSGGSLPGAQGSYPGYILKNQQGTTIKSFGYNSVGSGLSAYENDMNLCLGWSADLLPGQYTIVIDGGSAPFVQAYTLTPIINQRWWYGGGIRIKGIAHFSDSSAPRNYFDMSPFEQGAYRPAKRVTYTYNLFADPTVSSGDFSIDTESDDLIVRYKNVTVFEGNGDGRTEYSFFTASDFSTESDFRFGKLKNKKIYSDDGVLQLDANYLYEYFDIQTYGDQPFVKTVGLALPKEITKSQYFSGGGVVTDSDKFEYDESSYELIQKTSATSRSTESLITKYKYSILALFSVSHKHRRELYQTEEYLNTKLLSTSGIEYASMLTDNGSYYILPSQIKQSKGDNVLKVKQKNNRYDKYGHILETEKEGGIKTSFIWAYNHTQIVAEIVNMDYSSIPASLITAIQNATDTLNPPVDLHTALNNLRNAPELSQALITSYTYKPLVGILTKTDARGYKISYEYDSNNRQVRVKDQNGNIITENVYNTKPQN